jgi:hypothetical protein
MDAGRPGGLPALGNRHGVGVEHSLPGVVALVETDAEAAPDVNRRDDFHDAGFYLIDIIS